MGETDREIEQLIQAEALPTDFTATVERFYRPVAERIAWQHRAAGRMLVAGACGPQGSGKSTMVAFLKVLLGRAGLRAAIISIDDLYLTRGERERLAKEVHPLLATRGPPGTHDVALGIDVLTGLSSATEGTQTLIPRFDKAKDDRAPEGAWEQFMGPVDIVLFEGWCVGATPQTSAALATPINTLEREEDADGIWRTYVNQALAGQYQSLFARIDHLTMLKPPSFDSVLEWRALQESKMAAKAGPSARIMSRADVARFIQYYERLTRHVLAEMPSRANVVVDLDAAHRVAGTSFHIPK